MPASAKRKRNSSDRSVSPPQLRRRTRLQGTSQSEPATTSGDEHNIAIYSWNINGINPLLQKRINFSDASKLIYPLREVLKSHNWPHFLCLQEVKISGKDASAQRRVELAANSGGHTGEPTYTTHFSLPRDKYNATGFGGKVHGVATLIRDDRSGLEVSTSCPSWDLEGRVLVHEFKKYPLVVINGYWVNGTSNPYRNPISGEVEGTRHDHKLRFHAHMLDLCKSIESNGKSVLLIGDMNVAPSRIDGFPNLRTSPVQHVKNRADFNSKFLDQEAEDGLRGVDVFRSLHGEERKFTYHGRGRPWGESCDRVDLTIASRQLTALSGIVTGTGICDTVAERGHSDHVPIWVSIDMSRIKEAVGAQN